MDNEPTIPTALLTIVGVFFFFAAIGLIVSSLGALRRWWFRRKLGR